MGVALALQGVRSSPANGSWAPAVPERPECPNERRLWAERVAATEAPLDRMAPVLWPPGQVSSRRPRATPPQAPRRCYVTSFQALRKSLTCCASSCSDQGHIFKGQNPPTPPLRGHPEPRHTHCTEQSLTLGTAEPHVPFRGERETDERQVQPRETRVRARRQHFLHESTYGAMSARMAQ